MSLFEFDHPLIRHKLAALRDKNTDTRHFRELTSEITMLMCYEATRTFPVKETLVETPVGQARCQVLSGSSVCLIPVLRAGLGMTEGMLRLIPDAKVGHVGLYRDPDTLLPVEYYCKLPPDMERCETIVLDPMLATGGSASAAITFLKEKGAKAIRMMNIIGARQGVEKISEDHPDVDIYCAVVDDSLNDHAYIVPGLGDAGDRLFGTF